MYFEFYSYRSYRFPAKQRKCRTTKKRNNELRCYFPIYVVFLLLCACAWVWVWVLFSALPLSLNSSVAVCVFVFRSSFFVRLLFRYINIQKRNKAEYTASLEYYHCTTCIASTHTAMDMAKLKVHTYFISAHFHRKYIALLFHFRFRSLYFSNGVPPPPILLLLFLSFVC